MSGNVFRRKDIENIQMNSYTVKNTELKIQMTCATPESKISPAFLAWHLSFLCSIHYASSEFLHREKYRTKNPDDPCNSWV